MNHQFITYNDAINRILTGTIDKPYIAFSSDDGFKNSLRAAEVLNEYNAKACFFINPGIIGETDFDKINKYCTETLAFPPVEFLNWDEVAHLQKWGHEIGSHTMMHMNIAKATEQKIKDDMRQTFRILNERCGSVKHFAYPYGRFFIAAPLAGRRFLMRVLPPVLPQKEAVILTLHRRFTIQNYVSGGTIRLYARLGYEPYPLLPDQQCKACEHH